MATQLQIRRGTSSQVAAFTGAVGELVVNTTNDSVHVNDGSTAGGFELARVDGSNWANITTTANIDVGTVTADGLTVSNSSLQVKLEEADGTYNPRLVTYFDSSGTHLQHTWSSGADSLFLEYGGSEGSGTKAIGIQNGDVSFYEDTGTTPKMFWDASAESLGIGLSNPLMNLHLSSSGDTGIQITKDGSVASRIKTVSGALAIGVDGANGDTERMRIDASGDLTVKGGRIYVNESDNGNTAVAITRDADEGYVNLYSSGTQTVQIRGNGDSYFNGGRLLVGTTSNSAGEALQVDANSVGATVYTARMHNSNTSTSAYNVMRFSQGASGSAIGMVGTGGSATSNTAFRNSFVVGTQSSSPLVFVTADAERARIDSSGNVGIGTTNPASLLTIQDATPVFEIDSTTTSNTATIQFTSSGTVDSKITHQANTGILTIDSGRNSSWGGNIYFVTDTSTRMVINSSGNVGIGVTSPEAKLHVKDNSVLIGDAVSGYATLNFHSDTDGSARYGSIRKNYDSPFDMRIRASNSTGTAPIIFENSNNSEAMRVDASGNLLVGTATAGGQGGLTVYPNGSGTLAQVAWKRAANASANNAAAFFTGGSVVGTISVGDTSTAYNTSSDQRLKDNIVDADDAGSKVDAIQVRQFDWIADGSHQDYGMVAQELQSVAPEAVTGDADSDEMMGVDYSKLVPMLVKEIQSLRARVQQLEND